MCGTYTLSHSSGSPALYGTVFALPRRPRLPSFHELTESITDSEDDSLYPQKQPTFPNPAAASPSASKNRFPTSYGGARVTIASFVNPDSNTGNTSPVIAPPGPAPNPAASDVPPQMRITPSFIADHLRLNDDETFVIDRYPDLLKDVSNIPIPHSAPLHKPRHPQQPTHDGAQISCGSSGLYDFGERLSVQWRREPGPYGRTIACLPSRGTIQKMVASWFSVRKKLKDIEDLVNQADKEDAATQMVRVSRLGVDAEGVGGGALAERVKFEVAVSRSASASKKKKKEDGAVQAGRVKVRFIFFSMDHTTCDLAIWLPTTEVRWVAGERQPD